MNRAYFCYKTVANVEPNAAPTAIFIPGRSNRDDVAFQRAKDRGAEINPYFNLVERNIERVSALDDQFYMGDRVSAPLWGGNRKGYQDKTLLLDIRPGSEWVKFAVDFLSGIIRSRMFSGFFLDVIGGQLFMSNYKAWPIGERQEWAASAVETLRLIYEMCRAEDETFTIMNNNHWNQAPQGEKYVNGICIEHPGSENSEILKPFANRAYGDGRRRRVLVITKDKAQTEEWRAVPGVTHIAQVATGTLYGEAQPVDLPYTDLRLGELSDRVAELHSENVALHASLDESNEEAKQLRQAEADARARIENAATALGYR